MHKISVIMSIFNETVDDIYTSIESILNQTIQDFEIVIVHDNPNDTNRYALMNDICQLDCRITTIINQTNCGLALSMNKASEVATGEYLFRMDSDDICLPNRFERQLQILETKNCDVVFSNYSCIDELGNSIDKGSPALSSQSDEKEMMMNIIFNGMIHHPTVAIKRDIFRKVGGYRAFPCSQDQDLWLRLINNGAIFCMIDEVLLYYRIRKSSISGKNRMKQQLTILYSLVLFFERIKNGYDSYSLENYENYLNNRMNSNEKKRFEKADTLLIKASKTKRPFYKLICRIRAFIISKSHRAIFLLKIKYGRRIINNFNWRVLIEK